MNLGIFSDFEKDKKYIKNQLKILTVTLKKKELFEINIHANYSLNESLHVKFVAN